MGEIDDASSVPMTDIGVRVRIARGEMTQNELREKVGLKTQMAISNIETGITKTPKLDTLQKIADATGRSLDWILNGDRPTEAHVDADDSDAPHPEVEAYLRDHPEVSEDDGAELRGFFKRSAMPALVREMLPQAYKELRLRRLEAPQEPPRPQGNRRTMAERDADIRARRGKR